MMNSINEISYNSSDDSLDNIELGNIGKNISHVSIFSQESDSSDNSITEIIDIKNVIKKNKLYIKCIFLYTLLIYCLYNISMNDNNKELNTSLLLFVLYNLKNITSFSSKKRKEN